MKIFDQKRKRVKGLLHIRIWMRGAIFMGFVIVVAIDGSAL